MHPVEDNKTVTRPSFRYQRTIAHPVETQGVGFLTGAMVRMRFLPARPGTGIRFVRVDLRNRPTIPACLEEVTGTERRTTLGWPPAQVSMVEHVLACLSGLRIDNCEIEADAPEPPGLDGSSAQFVEALQDAGCVLQSAHRAIWSVDEPLQVKSGGATLTLHPPENNELKVSYLLDYGPDSPIVPQRHTEIVNPETFARELAPCRTFLLEHEALALRRQGFGQRTTAADLLIFGEHGPIDNTLRFANEPARHKILDIIGDLSLLGHDLHGHVVAHRSGHPLNIELARALRTQFGANGNPARMAA